MPGHVLARAGYEIAEPGASYWFERHWDAEVETWFLPRRVGAQARLRLDSVQQCTQIDGNTGSRRKIAAHLWCDIRGKLQDGTQLGASLD